MRVHSTTDSVATNADRLDSFRSQLLSPRCQADSNLTGLQRKYTAHRNAQRWFSSQSYSAASSRARNRPLLRTRRSVTSREASVGYARPPSIKSCRAQMVTFDCRSRASPPSAFVLSFLVQPGAVSSSLSLIDHSQCVSDLLPPSSSRPRLSSTLRLLLCKSGIVSEPRSLVPLHNSFYPPTLSSRRQPPKCGGRAVLSHHRQCVSRSVYHPFLVADSLDSQVPPERRNANRWASRTYT